MDYSSSINRTTTSVEAEMEEWRMVRTDVVRRVCRSIVSFFRRLLKALVGDHFVLDGDKDLFKRGGVLPVVEETQVLHVAVALVHAGQVYFVIELQNGGFLRVLRSALDAQTVDASVKVGLRVRASTL